MTVEMSEQIDGHQFGVRERCRQTIVAAALKTQFFVCIVKDNWHGHHTITRLSAHLIWSTKYRYHVLQGDVKARCCDLLIQVCDAEDVCILSGVVSKDYMQPADRISAKTCFVGVGQTAQRSLCPRLLQAEFPELKARYCDNHFWAIGYGAWITGNITDEMVQEYLEHHRHYSSKDNDPFILE